MPLKESQKLELRTNATRDKAEALLERLLEVREAATRQAMRSGVVPPRRAEAAQRLINRAIESTQNVIQRLNESLHDPFAELRKPRRKRNV